MLPGFSLAYSHQCDHGNVGPFLAAVGLTPHLSIRLPKMDTDAAHNEYI